MEKSTYIYGTTEERAALFSAVSKAQDLLAGGESISQAKALGDAQLRVLHVPEQGALTTILAHENGGHIETRYIYGDRETPHSAKALVLDVLLGTAGGAHVATEQSAAPHGQDEEPAAKKEAANAATMTQPPRETRQEQPVATDAASKALITDPATAVVQEGKLKIQGATLSQLAVIEQFAPSKYAGAALTALQVEITAARSRLQPKAA